MKSFLPVIAGLASLAAAIPTTSKLPGYPSNTNLGCLSDAQANFIVNTFSQILSLPDRTQAAALAALVATDGYTDYSDSLNMLLGTPIGRAATSGRKAFVAGVAQNPPVTVTTLGVFHDCNHISWRWLFTDVGDNTYPVRGVEDLYVIPSTGQVYLNYFEFNNIAWGVDDGATFSPPPPSPTTSTAATGTAATTAIPASVSAQLASMTAVPGYPTSLNKGCLSDSQAQFIASTFQLILSNHDRGKAAAAAYLLGDTHYTDYSDSINIIAGYPLETPATHNNTEFAYGVYSNSPVAASQLDVFHDCTHISWRWEINGIGKYRVRGISDMTVNPATGRVLENDFEFNAIAWNVDFGGTFTPPPSSS